VTLSTLVDHIDHICQVTGSVRHVGIGSDLDGAFGREQTAADLETIADLTKILDLLSRRGYRSEDVAAVASGNFVRVLGEALPA
jgi:membrane dipeptidase